MAHREFVEEGFVQNLAHLVEECGEVLAAAGKTARFGPTSVNPLLPVEAQETNLAWLLREAKDLRGALDRLEEAAWHEFGQLAP